MLDSAPFRNVDPEQLASHEDSIAAWQLDVGHELAGENIPLAQVVLVVEGSLRVSGRDALGNPFTLRRVHAGDWWGLWGALSGVSPATCRTTESTKLLAVPVEVLQQWFRSSSELEIWLESHPQREDLYAALRPLLAERPRQDRTFLDEIDQLQSMLRTAQVREPAAIQSLTVEESGTSWLIPSVAHLLPDLDSFGAEGLSKTSLERLLQRSPFGLRLVGYPTDVLQELIDRPVPSPSIASEADGNRSISETNNGAVEELPEWQNPDGEALLAAALRQEQGKPARDSEGLHVTPIFGQSGIEQGLALLQMICESLRVPFRRDVVDRMLKGMVAVSLRPLENIGQIVDGLGLNAVLMSLPSAHLRRLSLPESELPQAEGLVLVTGSARGNLRVVDPREGERWINLAEPSKNSKPAVQSP